MNNDKELQIQSLRVCLVGRVEKWKDRKKFNFPPFYLVESGKIEG